MPKLLKVTNEKGTFLMHCPGCDQLHQIWTEKAVNRPQWGFNGDMENPTFTPSLLVKGTMGNNHEPVTCHSFIRDGQWQFLNDCTHKLAGQTVPMVEVED